MGYASPACRLRIVSPSVVSITATLAQGGAQGSGVIIDKTHVLTNNHVVSGAEKLTVTLADGRTFEAEVRGTDPSTDLAVITMPTSIASVVAAMKASMPMATNTYEIPRSSR